MNNRRIERQLERLEELINCWGEERLKKIPVYRNLIKLRDEIAKEPKNTKSYRRWQKRRRKNRKKKARMK